MASGTGADNSGSHDSHASSLTVGNFTCKYHTYSVYNAGSDPSICEVYFYCFSEEVNCVCFVGPRSNLEDKRGSY